MKTARITTKEQELLVLENQGLIGYCIKGLYITDYEDMFSVGNVGLVKAAATYDKSIGTSFAQYAKKIIKNELFSYLKKERIYINQSSLDEETAATDSIFAEKIENNMIFVRILSIILNLLCTKETLLMLYSISGIHQEKIAQKLGISRTYLSRFFSKTLDKVRDLFNSNDKFNETFMVSLKNDYYRISFPVKRLEQLDFVVENYTLREKNTKCTIKRNSNQIIVQMPINYPEAFGFLAEIVQSMNTDGKLRNTNKFQDITKYILAMDTFSIQDISSYFKNMSRQTLYNNIKELKDKGFIKCTSRGNYIVNKIECKPA